MSSEVVWMTPAALESLSLELSALTTPPRELTEDERARVVELTDLVRRSEVQRKPDDGLVEPGMRVTVRNEDGSVFEFVLGSRALLDLDTSLDVEVFSPDSPLGSAINGLYVGDEAVVSAPNGSHRLVVIKAIPVA